MKLSFLLFICAFIFFSGIITRAQIILGPGGEKTFTNDPATGGEAGDNGNFLFLLDSDFNTSSKTIKAEASGYASVGNGSAYALIYYDFQISETSGTHNNTVGAWINYNVFWKGFQEILSTLGSNSYVLIEMNLRDRTNNDLVFYEVIHNLDLKTHSYKFITGGFDFDDSDTKVNTIPVILRRGHDYRLHLKLTSTLLITSPTAIPSYCDYMNGFIGGGDGRVELTKLFIKVGLDEKETLMKLAQIDSLESRIDTLEYRLENHYHEYLTGRGVGHNNTEANTTLSIFETGNNSSSGAPVFFGQQQNSLPDENDNNQLAPDDFALRQNYPNPFNPSTKISFALPNQEMVSIKVFDILGRQIDVLMNEVKDPGYYEINFNAETLPSGTYLYEIRAGSFIETKKMILIK
jgi:hypothetical protein